MAKIWLTQKNILLGPKGIWSHKYQKNLFVASSKLFSQCIINTSMFDLNASWKFKRTTSPLRGALTWKDLSLYTGSFCVNPKLEAGVIRLWSVFWEKTLLNEWFVYAERSEDIKGVKRWGGGDWRKRSFRGSRLTDHARERALTPFRLVNTLILIPQTLFLHILNSLQYA